MIADYVASLVALNRRPITLTIARTRVAAPDEFEATLHAPEGYGHVQIVVARVNVFARDSEFCTLRADETTQTVSLPSAAWNRFDHLRFRSEVSLIGLVTARRWTTQIVPELSLVPEAHDAEVDLQGTDEAGRLREYLPGDRVGMVSWSTTARTGQLHVRAPSQDTDETVVVVDLGGIAGFLDDGANIEATVGRALQLGEGLLAQGHVFRLITSESMPHFEQATRDMALASPRRRARPELEHRPGEEHEYLFQGRPLKQVALSIVHDRDELIRRLAAVDAGSPIPRPAGPYIEVTPTGVSAKRP